MDDYPLPSQSTSHSPSNATVYHPLISPMVHVLNSWYCTPSSPYRIDTSNGEYVVSPV